MNALLAVDGLLTLERDGWDSLCRAEGGTFYGELMTSDALMILSNGMILDRAAIIDSLNEAAPWVTYELSDVRLVPTGADSAALVYQASATREGQDEPFVALMASVYRLIDEKP